MKTISDSFTCKYEVKKSTFIASLVPFDDFENTKAKLKSEHTKANHIVWAYRYLNEFDQVVENCSDDGEPKGTSGPPTLNVLKGVDLINCAVLIVRYFGGIKLGTGGLVRAYSASCNEVIKIANLLLYEKLTCKSFYVPYHLLQRFEHFFDKNHFAKGEKNFTEDGVKWQIDMSQKELELFTQFAKEFEYQGLKVD